MTNKQPWECPKKYLKELNEVNERIKDWESYNSKKSHSNLPYEEISEERLRELNLGLLSAPRYQRLKGLKQS